MPLFALAQQDALPEHVANPAGLRIVAGGEHSAVGESMTRGILIAVLILASALPSWAAGNKEKGPAKVACMPPNAIEAQAAIRYMTELGVATNACSSVGIYADFRTRNRDAILGYQNVLVAHFKGNAAYDKWNTSLANAVAQKQSGSGITPQQFCEQSMPLMEQAKTLDPAKFHAVAVERAAADTQTVKCGK